MRFRVAILAVIAFAASLIGAHAAIYLDRDGINSSPGGHDSVSV